MTSRRLAALAILPAAALAMTSCSSSTSGSGSGGSSNTPSTPAGGSTSSSATSTGSSAGSSTGSAPTDAQGLGELLKQGTDSTTSAHIELNVSASGETITGTGDEQLSGGKLKALQLSEQIPNAGTIEIIIVDGKAYAKLPSSITKTSKPYVLLSTSSSNAAIKQIASSLNSSINSASLGQVSTFVDAAASVKLQGNATINGTSAYEYLVVVDPSKLPSTFPGKDSLSAAGVKSIPVELYIDKSGHPLKVTENLTVEGHPVSTAITVTDYNKPVTISAPPASQVGTS